MYQCQEIGKSSPLTKLLDLLQLFPQGSPEGGTLQDYLARKDKENMVAMISVGDIFRAENLFEAALKMARANMTWLRNKVEKGMKMDIH